MGYTAVSQRLREIAGRRKRGLKPLGSSGGDAGRSPNLGCKRLILLDRKSRRSVFGFPLGTMPWRALGKIPALDPPPIDTASERLACAARAPGARAAVRTLRPRRLRKGAVLPPGKPLLPNGAAVAYALRLALFEAIFGLGPIWIFWILRGGGPARVHQRGSSLESRRFSLGGRENPDILFAINFQRVETAETTGNFGSEGG